MLTITRFGSVTRFDSARTIAGRGYYWTSAYLVDGMMIDTGCAYSAEEMALALKDQNLALIVNTHSHEDHIGANGILQDQRTGLKVMAHPSALAVLEQPRQAQPLQWYRRTMWGWPRPSIGHPIQDGERIETENYRFQVIHTPGHSPDHICFYEPQQGWLFTGDLFVGGRDRALRVDYDIWQIIDSLKRVANLPLTRLFPGSARVKENPNPKLAAKIDYLEETGNRVLKLHSQGLSVGAIARKVFKGFLFLELITFGHFSKRNLVKSYLMRSEKI